MLIFNNRNLSTKPISQRISKVPIMVDLLGGRGVAIQYIKLSKQNYKYGIQ